MHCSVVYVIMTSALTGGVVSTLTVRDWVIYSWYNDIPCDGVYKV